MHEIIDAPDRKSKVYSAEDIKMCIKNNLLTLREGILHSSWGKGAETLLHNDIISENEIFDSIILGKDCPLKSLPDGLTINGLLSLAGCQYLLKLPQRIRARSIAIERLSINEIPNDMVCDIINVRECNNISSLPRRIKADSVVFNNCDGFAAIMPESHFRNITFNECAALSCIQENAVFSSIDIYRCNAFRKIGNGVRVSGNMSLVGCHNLTALPNDLVVDGNLDLRGSGITKIPATIKVRGKIIPESICHN